MSVIHLDPEFAGQTAAKLQSGAADIQAQTDALRSQLRRLDVAWQSPRASALIARITEVQAGLALSAGQMTELQVALQREIEQWLLTDQQGASRIQGKGGVRNDFWSQEYRLNHPLEKIPLPVSGGFGPVDLTSFTVPLGFSLTTLLLNLTGLPVWLQNWLRTLMGGNSPAPVSPEEPAVPHMTFGDLLKMDDPPSTSSPSASTAQPSPPSATSTPAAETTPSATPSASTTTPAPVAAVAAPTQPIHPNIYYDVPTEAQGTSYGNHACSATSVSMVTNYYHNLDPKNQAVSTDGLIKVMDKSDGTYGQGITLTNLDNEIQNMGYKQPEVKINAKLTDLTDQLKSGPVIVTTGVKITGDPNRSLVGPGNVIHAMVIKGISDDQKSIIVNDPWSGKEVTLGVDDFTKMWDKGADGMYVIRP
jgi:hypothetical protein